MFCEVPNLYTHFTSHPKLFKPDDLLLNNIEGLKDLPLFTALNTDESGILLNEDRDIKKLLVLDETDQKVAYKSGIVLGISQALLGGLGGLTVAYVAGAQLPLIIFGGSLSSLTFALVGFYGGSELRYLSLADTKVNRLVETVSDSRFSRLVKKIEHIKKELELSNLQDEKENEQLKIALEVLSNRRISYLNKIDKINDSTFVKLIE